MNTDFLISTKDNFRSGFVAILGRPNVGKSTLLNKLLEFKLSIVTPKAQTTRHKIIGIISRENHQIVFLDTPGIITPRYRLQELMMKKVHNALEESDVILFLLETRRDYNELEKEILEKLSKEIRPVIFVINKIDLISKELLLPQITFLQSFNPKEIIPISALNGDGLSILEEAIVNCLPKSPPYYPPEMLTQSTERFLVAELVREELFLQLHQELPYSISVLVDEFKERKNNKPLYIRAIIYVNRKSQKGMVIGKKGETLKVVGKNARTQIEDLLEKQVYLDLWVKIRKDWRDTDNELKRLGYS